MLPVGATSRQAQFAQSNAADGQREAAFRSAPGDAGSPQPTTAHPASVTIRTLRRMVERGEKFACLTCYDATTARWLEQAGVPVLLVGDTAAEVILGLPGTIHAPLDFLITITAAVKRGAPRAFVIGDMPFMSYQADEAEGLRNAARFLVEGAADAVKLEVDRSHAELVRRMSAAGIPVIAHIGSRPQLAKLRGGYGSTGKTADEARSIMADAAVMQEAGAMMLLIEAAPNELAARIVERTSIPVIGCGAGPACHGQIVVLQDLLGLTDWQPAFARPVVNLGERVVEAARTWLEKVRSSDLGPHPYHMSAEELRKL